MSEQRTRDHQPPARPDAARARPALVAAFPSSVAAPLPRGPIGRSWLEAIGAPDDEVSGAHAEFSHERGVTSMIDIGSRNGTYVDGTRVTPGMSVPLGDGAVLRMGRTIFVHRSSFAGPLAPSPPLGGLVGPYGLRALAATVESSHHTPPRNVLLLGETGSGKELAAAYIASVMGRTPYVPVNVAALPGPLFEAHLFGHTAGAFSDAKRASRGVVGGANGGAILLDELGDLPLELQPKLLRLLENREVLPVGAERPSHVDVLILAATHHDLSAMVERGAFRRDLLARLAIATARLPPLRERPEDLFAILRALVAARGGALDPARCEVEAVERLLLCEWPANVRDLLAVIAQARLADPDGRLTLWTVEAALPPSRRSPPSSGEAPSSSGRALTEERVRRVLESTAGNESEAARVLGVSRGALRRFLGKA